MLDPAQSLQAGFLLAASTILFLNCIPTIREHFISYGPRTAAPAKASQNEKKKPQSQRTKLEKILDSIASLQVPHAYFNHFYIVSVAASLFWAFQFFTNGKFLQRLSAASSGPDANMSMEQIELTWALMGIQGLRRQLESSVLAKPSTSKMWIGHYILGIVFYLAMSIAVWIEGAATLSHPPLNRLTISPPSSPHTLLALPLFLLASGIQHDSHTHLSHLPKYTLPTHPIFRLLICPHYTAECLIYISLSLIAAPPGQWVNRTVLAAGVFVAANLGVTARGTRAWYEARFGWEAVRRRWVLVPFIW